MSIVIYISYNRGWGFDRPRFFISGLDIAVVKKTFRYPNVFFYNRLYRNSLFRNFIMESGITLIFLREISYLINGTLSTVDRNYLGKPDYCDYWQAWQAFGQGSI